MTITDHQPIIVGVDGSRASSAALRYAAREALRTGADLRLLHVLPGLTPLTPAAPTLPRDLEATGRALLAAAAAEVSAVEPTVRCSTDLLHAPRVHVLVEAAQDARSIVLGHERGRTVDRLMVGSTVPGVAAAARCPVVAVPPDWSAADEHGCVLVGVKHAAASGPLLRRALDLAAERGARLLVVHAWELPGEYAELAGATIDVAAWRERARHEVEVVLAPAREDRPGTDVEVRIVHGQPARVLQRASGEADVLVLARRARAFPFGHLGGTARALLRHSDCPVAVVPPDERQ